MSIHVFGLTGGIGSGKSLVAARFRARGVPVQDADELAREVVAPGSEGLQEIVRTFGDHVLTAEGELDRSRVARLVFADELARHKLGAITHPRVRALALQDFEVLDHSGHPIACYEVPLLFENGLAERFRPVVVVNSSPAVSIARVRERDGSTEQEVRTRMSAQLPLSHKVAQADHVIDNDGPERDTLAQADEVLDAILRSLSIEVRRYPLP